MAPPPPQQQQQQRATAGCLPPRPCGGAPSSEQAAYRQLGPPVVVRACVSAQPPAVHQLSAFDCSLPIIGCINPKAFIFPYALEPARLQLALARTLATFPVLAGRIGRYTGAELRGRACQLPYYVACTNQGVPLHQAACSLPGSAFTLGAQVRRGFSFNYYHRHFLPPYMQVSSEPWRLVPSTGRYYHRQGVEPQRAKAASAALACRIRSSSAQLAHTGGAHLAAAAQDLDVPRMLRGAEPPCRVQLTRLADGACILAITTSHALLDGRSFAMFVNALAAASCALASTSGPAADVGGWAAGEASAEALGPLPPAVVVDRSLLLPGSVPLGISPAATTSSTCKAAGSQGVSAAGSSSPCWQPLQMGAAAGPAASGSGCGGGFPGGQEQLMHHLSLHAQRVRERRGLGHIMRRWARQKCALHLRTMHGTGRPVGAGHRAACSCAAWACVVRPAACPGSGAAVLAPSAAVALAPCTSFSWPSTLPHSLWRATAGTFLESRRFPGLTLDLTTEVLHIPQHQVLLLRPRASLLPAESLNAMAATSWPAGWLAGRAVGRLDASPPHPPPAPW
jgi:hypothetical protein